MNGLDDLLTRGETLAQDLATQALTHGVEKRAHHAEFHVGFEQGGANVSEGLVEVRVAETALGAQRRAESVEAFTEGVKHAWKASVTGREASPRRLVGQRR
jgi:hypothetical protein